MFNAPSRFEFRSTPTRRGQVVVALGGNMSVRGLLALLLCQAALFGCRPVVSGPPGDVTFFWTVIGGTCADHPEVQSIRINIPGEVLANGGVYPCSVNGTDGIVLHDFAAGGYSFDIDAVGYSNQVLYVSAGTFDVLGNTAVQIDLTPVGVPPSYAYLSWTFPGGVNCAQAGISFVDVTIDGQTTQYECVGGT